MWKFWHFDVAPDPWNLTHGPWLPETWHLTPGTCTPDTWNLVPDTWNLHTWHLKSKTYSLGTCILNLPRWELSGGSLRKSKNKQWHASEVPCHQWCYFRFCRINCSCRSQRRLPCESKCKTDNIWIA